MNRPHGVSRPWSVQVELVEGCQLRCAYCGIHGLSLSPGEYHFMSRETALVAARGIAGLCPAARVEFAMHGEPLLSPFFVEIVALFRSVLPRAQLMVTTNGLIALESWPRALLLMNDLNVVVLDCYEPYGQRLRQEVLQWWAATGGGGWRVWDFYRDGYSPWHNHGPREKAIVLMDDLVSNSGRRLSRVVFNHVGLSLPPYNKVPSIPLQKGCTLPFRELAIRWDGRIGLCCEDWILEYPVGDICQEPLSEIWRGPRLESARRLLAARQRQFVPCARCNHGAGSRAGLLPKYALPSARDFAIVAEVNAEGARVRTL